MAEPLTIQLQAKLDGFLGGDPAALDDLVALAESRLRALARRRLRAFGPGAEESAALVTEAYLRLRTSVAAVRPPTVRQFLGLAALHMQRALLDLARSAKRRGAAADLPDDGAGGEGRDADAVIDLFDAMAKLDADRREVVDLLFFHGLTQREAAEVLGVHEDTVKKKWAGARVLLAKHLHAFSDG